MYCFDTSAFLDAWSRWHPIDVFPCVWGSFSKAFLDDIIISPYPVLPEILKWAPDLSMWINDRRHNTYFLDNTSEVRTLSDDILERYDDLIDKGKYPPQADPDVIALAKLRDIPLVTGEKPRKKVTNPHRIPDVCNDLGVDCIDIIKFMRREKWLFE